MSNGLWDRGRFVFGYTGAVQTTGGIANVNRSILRVLETWGAPLRGQLVCLHEDESGRPEFCSLDGIDYVGCRGSKNEFAQILLRHAARPGTRILFDHVTLATPVLPLAMAGWCRTGIVAHGSESWRRIKRTSRWSFRSADVILANSEFTNRSMREAGVRGPIKVCPLGLGPEIRLNFEIPPLEVAIELDSVKGEKVPIGEQMLLLVGRLHPQEREKGHDQLLAVARQLGLEFPDVQLIFAGPGEDRDRLAEVAQSNGVGHRVFIPGRVDDELLADLYRRCFAYVMPSRQEGFGLVFLEAMNFGKACVACYDDGAADVVVDRETGLLVSDPDDQDELMGVLRRLLSRPEETAAMGRAGFARLHGHFTAAHVQKRFRNHLSQFFGC